MTKIRLSRTLNALMALILMGSILAAYFQQYSRHETPCPLCLLQRLGMIGVATGALLNLRFGIQPAHYAFSLLSAFVGGSVSIRQLLLHLCPGSPVFGYPVLGLSLYTWAFLTFCSSIIGIILLLFLEAQSDKDTSKMNWFEHGAFALVFILTLLNFITTFDECALGFCKDVPWPQP